MGSLRKGTIIRMIIRMTLPRGEVPAALPHTPGRRRLGHGPLRSRRHDNGDQFRGGADVASHDDILAEANGADVGGGPRAALLRRP